ncbi:MAG TPA: hypothetical protein VLB80_04015 [Candidatus Babeliales bacterium]|nr:hypothetical protein [Candidatus Babeliales bacterium]
MKKNIVCNCSLLLLLLTNSYVISMQQEQSDNNNITLDFENSDLAIDIEFIFGLKTTPNELQTVDFSTTKAEETTTINNDLFSSDFCQSVSLPKPTKEGLGWVDTVKFSLGCTIKNIISYLKQGTFDTDNATHLSLLLSAIQQATERKDTDSLLLIAALCQQNDQTKKIRISDKLAQTSFACLKSEYEKKLFLHDSTMHDKNESYTLQRNVRTDLFAKTLTNAITAYKEDTKKLADNHNTSLNTLLTEEEERMKTLIAQMNTFGILNSSIRTNIQKLSQPTQPTQPTNLPEQQIFEKNEQIKNNLTTLLQQSFTMPTIMELSPNNNDIKQLTNQ